MYRKISISQWYTVCVRQAFALLGFMTLMVTVGAFIAFSRSPKNLTMSDVSHNYQASEYSMKFTLISPAFIEGGLIPSRYTCDGENISVPLHIEGVPEGTKALVLVMDDPDIPDSVKQSLGVETVDHYVVYNIPPETVDIDEGKVVGVRGKNVRGDVTYTGPCPPDKEHRYFFRLYAVNDMLSFETTPTLHEVEEVAKRTMVGVAILMGRYERIKN